jgi:hypothetical protein
MAAAGGQQAGSRLAGLLDDLAQHAVDSCLAFSTPEAGAGARLQLVRCARGRRGRSSSARGGAALLPRRAAPPCCLTSPSPAAAPRAGARPSARSA